MQMLRLPVLLLILTLLLASCIRKEEPGDRRFDGEAAGRSAAEQAAEREPGDAGAATEPSAPDDATAREPGDAGAAAVPAAAEPSSVRIIRRVPGDVVIGELEDHLDGPGEVIAVIEQLFSEVAAGRIPEAILAAEVRDQLSNRLDYMSERSEVAPEVRIGALALVSPGTYRAPVVAFGSRGGRTTGEIYVAESDGSWYISDILVDFTRIDADGERPIFEPGSEGPTILSF